MPGRELTIKKYNLDLYDPYETDGPFEMPVIKKMVLCQEKGLLK